MLSEHADGAGGEGGLLSALGLPYRAGGAPGRYGLTPPLLSLAGGRWLGGGLCWLCAPPHPRAAALAEPQCGCPPPPAFM